MGCSPPGSSVHGILRARTLEQVATSYSRGSSLTQGSNPCLLHLLHWQANSLPLVLPGKPKRTPRKTSTPRRRGGPEAGISLDAVELGRKGTVDLGSITGARGGHCGPNTPGQACWEEAWMQAGNGQQRMDCSSSPALNPIPPVPVHMLTTVACN